MKIAAYGMQAIRVNGVEQATLKKLALEPVLVAFNATRVGFHWGVVEWCRASRLNNNPYTVCVSFIESRGAIYNNV